MNDTAVDFRIPLIAERRQALARSRRRRSTALLAALALVLSAAGGAAAASGVTADSPTADAISVVR
jgi:hypothetical protein